MLGALRALVATLAIVATLGNRDAKGTKGASSHISYSSLGHIYIEVSK